MTLSVLRLLVHVTSGLWTNDLTYSSRNHLSIVLEISSSTDFRLTLCAISRITASSAKYFPLYYFFHTQLDPRDLLSRSRCQGPVVSKSYCHGVTLSTHIYSISSERHKKLCLGFSLVRETSIPRFSLLKREIISVADNLCRFRRIYADFFFF